MSSLRQLAKQLDISAATVSAALRGMPNVKRETRERVLLLAKQKGYHHNPLASSVMGAMRRSHGSVFRGTIGIVRPLALVAGSPATRRCADLVAGARIRADTLGYHIDEISVGRGPQEIARLPDIVNARGFSGLLVAPPMNPDVAHALARLKIPVIYGDLFDDEASGESVCPDYHQGIALALSRLKAMGHRNPGLMLDSDLSDAAQARCRAAVAEFSIRENRPWSAPYVFSLERDDHPAETWRLETRHDAILTTSPAFSASIFPGMNGQIFALGAHDSHADEGIDLHMGNVGRHALEILAKKVISASTGEERFSLRTFVACTWLKSS